MRCVAGMTLLRDSRTGLQRNRKGKTFKRGAAAKALQYSQAVLRLRELAILVRLLRVSGLFRACLGNVVLAAHHFKFLFVYFS